MMSKKISSSTSQSLRIGFSIVCYTSKRTSSPITVPRLISHLNVVNRTLERTPLEGLPLQDKADPYSSDSEISRSSSTDSDSLLSDSADRSDFQFWDKRALLSSISGSIDWLYKLSNLVRKASFSNQFNKANKHELKDEFDNDTTALLNRYFVDLIRREFKDLRDGLVSRIAASMVLRRRQIAYRQSRQKRWRLQQDEYVSRQRGTMLIEDPAVSYSSDPSNVVQPLEQSIEPEKPDNATDKVQTVTSTVPARMMNRGQYQRLPEPSQTSRGTTTSLAAKSRHLIPPPPAAAMKSQDFVCDFCCLVLASDLARDQKWWA